MSITWLQIAFVICVGAFTLSAAVWDVRERRIPNWLNVVALAGAIVWQLASDSWSGLGHAAAGLTAGFLPFFLAWMLGGNGAGDAKLLGALGAWFGPTMILFVMVASVILLLCMQIGGWIYSRLSGRSLIQSAQKPHLHQKMPFAVPVMGASWALGLFKVVQV